MTFTRSTKVFINDQDTTIGNAKYLATTLSGYVSVVFQDPDDETTVLRQQFDISTTQPAIDQLGHFRAGYLGRYESYKSYYKAEFQNVIVKRGNLTKKINGGLGSKFVACWIAAYDDRVLVFEIHYPNGSIYRTSDVDIQRNEHLQRVTEWLPALKGSTEDPCIQMSQPSLVKQSRREGTKLTLADEAHILHDLQNMKTTGMKQSLIAKRFGVTSAYISKLKKQLIADGKLSA